MKTPATHLQLLQNVPGNVDGDNQEASGDTGKHTGFRKGWGSS